MSVLIIYAMGYSASVMIGSTSPSEVEPLAGNSGNLIENSTRRSDPIIKDGIDTKAVVTTIITLSIILLRLSAATDPRTMPQISALNAAITPSFCRRFKTVGNYIYNISPTLFKRRTEIKLCNNITNIGNILLRQRFTSPYFASAAA